MLLHFPPQIRDIIAMHLSHYASDYDNKLYTLSLGVFYSSTIVSLKLVSCSGSSICTKYIS